MPDERQDSIRQGIGTPDESEAGKEAETKRRKRAAEGPQIGGAMGGTSDAESAGDESALNRTLREAERHRGAGSEGTGSGQRGSKPPEEASDENEGASPA